MDARETRRIRLTGQEGYQTTGEAGVGHLTEILNSYRFEDERAMLAFAYELLGEDTPTIRVGALGGTNLGYYRPWSQEVFVGAHLRVGVTVHELAHHYHAVCGGQGPGHGADFKAGLAVLAEAALKMLDLEVPEKPKRSLPGIRRGHRVRAKDTGATYRALRPLGRGWWVVEDDEGLTWQAWHKNLERI